jgi:NADPH:quinone reductase-like Zn-dependent oxidoreductase
MKAARIIEAGAAIRIETLPIPRPGPGEVLVRMHAAPINPSDLSTLRTGYMVRQWPVTPGLEGSGVVVAAGRGVLPALRKGKRVACSPNPGGDGTWAEYLCTSATRVVPLPASLDLEEGAMLLVNPLTALALVQEAKQGGHRAVVTNAAASALGKMLLKLCTREGIPLVCIVRKKSQEEALIQLGARHVLNSTDKEFEAQLAELCRRLDATLLLDAVGGLETGRLLKAALPSSTLMAYAHLSGESMVIDPVDFIRKDKLLEGFQLGIWLSSKNMITKLRLISRAKRRMSDDLATRVEARYPLEGIHDALDHYRKNMLAGKSLLVFDGANPYI